MDLHHKCSHQAKFWVPLCFITFEWALFFILHRVIGWRMEARGQIQELAYKILPACKIWCYSIHYWWPFYRSVTYERSFAVHLFNLNKLIMTTINITVYYLAECFFIVFLICKSFKRGVRMNTFKIYFDLSAHCLIFKDLSFHKVYYSIRIS